MKIAIAGTGYVGLVTGACFAEWGIPVTGIDTDAKKVEDLRQGVIPLYESGLKDLVVRNMNANRLSFDTHLADHLNETDILFIAVGTPSREDGSADLSHVLNVAKEIGQHLEKPLLVVTKSTVPVGSSEKVKQTISRELEKRKKDIAFDVASNPEFLQEGKAVENFMNPDRVIVGVDTARARALMEDLYRPLFRRNGKVLFMDIPSAEMTKYAANAMLATKISFINDIANLCESVGADINMVRRGIAADRRIGDQFLHPGCGYGGSCFPKDIRALIKTAAEHGQRLRVAEAVEEVNREQKEVLYKKLEHLFHGSLRGKNIAVWGLAFKPETDDMREASACVLIDKLLENGCRVNAYDPAAMETARKRWDDSITFSRDMYDATLNADALVAVTEWKEFRFPSWQVLKKTMKGNYVVDGRNLYDPEELAEAGFIHRGIGRRNPFPLPQSARTSRSTSHK